MSAIRYNSRVFTNVKKFDNNNNPLGVLVSGKLNQYNGQGYPILDSIDIDWNGAFVKNLDTYLNTTEDLINCLNISYSNFNNYVTLSQFQDNIQTINDNIDQKLDFSYAYTYTKFEEAINLINDVRTEIDFGSKQINHEYYYEVNYNDIVNDDKLLYDKKYYIFNKQSDQYITVSPQEIIFNPDRKYYINVIEDVLGISDDMNTVVDQIGYIKYDEDNDIYTYYGIIGKLHEYETLFNTIYDLAEHTAEIANTSYNYSYYSYSYIDSLRKQVKQNTNNIGYHTSYNVYQPASELSMMELTRYLNNNHNKIYRYNEDTSSYYITDFNTLYLNSSYIKYDKIIGTGIEREIELLDDKIYDNSYILYKLNTQNNSPDYIDLFINPTEQTSQSRTINIGIIQSNIDSETGSYTKGLITNQGLSNSLTYVFDWKILK